MANGTDQPSGWAIGFTAFAAFMLILIGIFHIISGIVAVAEDDLIVATSNYIFELDVTTWGWIHIIAGTVVLLAGFGILSGATWAIVVGIIVAMISMIANFLWIPYYPLWSILIIAIDIAVIWALTVYSEETSAGTV
jgi:hypothetical protein